MQSSVAVGIVLAVLSTSVEAHGKCSELGKWSCNGQQLWQCNGIQWVTVGGPCNTGTSCIVSSTFTGCSLAGSGINTGAPVTATTAAAPPAPSTSSLSLAGTACDATTAPFACDTAQNFLSCLGGVWTVADACGVDNGTCTVSGTADLPGFKGCIASSQNACSESQFGQWQCSGNNLQQCAYDPSFVTIQSCGEGYTCTVTANYAGCLPNELRHNELSLSSSATADAAPAASGLSTAAIASIGVAAGVVVAIVGGVLYRRKFVAAKGTLAAPESEAFVVA